MIVGDLAGSAMSHDSAGPAQAGLELYRGPPLLSDRNQSQTNQRIPNPTQPTLPPRTSIVSLANTNSPFHPFHQPNQTSVAHAPPAYPSYSPTMSIATSASTPSTSVHSLKHSPHDLSNGTSHQLMMNRRLSDPGREQVGVASVAKLATGRARGRRRSTSMPGQMERKRYEPLLIFSSVDAEAGFVDVDGSPDRAVIEGAAVDLDRHSARDNFPRAMQIGLSASQRSPHLTPAVANIISEDLPTDMPSRIPLSDPPVMASLPASHHAAPPLPYSHPPRPASHHASPPPAARVLLPLPLVYAANQPSPLPTRVAPRPAPGRTSTGEQEIQAVAALAGFRAVPLPPARAGEPSARGVDRGGAHVASGALIGSPPGMGRYGLLLTRAPGLVAEGDGDRSRGGEAASVPAGPELVASSSVSPRRAHSALASSPPPSAKKPRPSAAQAVSRKKATEPPPPTRTGGVMVKLERGVDRDAIEAARVLSGADIAGVDGRGKRAKPVGGGSVPRASQAGMAPREDVERHSCGQMDEGEIEARLKTAACLVQSASSATAQERSISAWVQEWIACSYEAHPSGTVSRTCLFARYCRATEAHGLHPSNAASFGKAMKTKFGEAVKTRRLGVRGNSRYHYIGLRPTCKAEADRLWELDVEEAGMPPRQVYVKKGRTGRRGPQANPARRRGEGEAEAGMEAEEGSDGSEHGERVEDEMEE